MQPDNVNWRRGLNRLFIALWAVWSVVLLGAVLVMGTSGGGAMGFGLGMLVVFGIVVPALLRWTMFWVIDGFSVKR